MPTIEIQLHPKKGKKEIFSLEEYFSVKRKRGVISKWTAAAFWGVTEPVAENVDITFPKGYNGDVDPRINKNYRSITRYKEELIEFPFNESLFRVYSLEKTMVELIKDSKGEFSPKLVSALKDSLAQSTFEIKKFLKLADKYKVKEIANAFIAALT